MPSGTDVIRHTVVRGLDVINILHEVQSIYCALIQKGCVAQVVRHHDGWIQGAEVQSRDWSIIIPFLRLDDRSSFVLLIGT
jgi:hypothetical protein